MNGLIFISVYDTRLDAHGNIPFKNELCFKEDRTPLLVQNTHQVPNRCNQ